jgi:predicted transcriptional regulator of viral defense system
MDSVTHPPQKSEPGGRFRGVDLSLAALGDRQHAVFGLWQLEGIGLSSRATQKRAQGGRLHRIYSAVYSLVPRTLLSRKGHWMAAALAFGPDAVVSHRTAAALHGLIDYNGSKTDVTVPGKHSRRRGNLIVHSSILLSPADLTTEDSIPCTTVARTLLDLADVVERRRLERAFDQAEMMGVFDLRAIEDQLTRNPKRPAARKLRALLDEYYVGEAPTESELEEAALALCRILDLPKPLVQRWLTLPDGGPPLRPDFMWPEQRVILEADGDRAHGTRQARERRNVRDQRLLVHGWAPLHASWRQLKWRPEELGPRLVALVTEPRPGRPPQAAAD